MNSFPEKKLSERKIAECTMAKIEVLEKYGKNDRGVNADSGHFVKISGHSPFVEHAKSLVENAVSVGLLEISFRILHAELSQVYYYFRGLDSTGNTLMTETEFNLFIGDVELADPMSTYSNRSCIRSIYENVSKTGDTYFGRLHNSKLICRQEFMECILRITYNKFCFIY